MKVLTRVEAKAVGLIARGHVGSPDLEPDGDLVFPVVSDHRHATFTVRISPTGETSCTCRGGKADKRCSHVIACETTVDRAQPCFSAHAVVVV